MASSVQLGESDDPVADLAGLGLAYHRLAMSNGHLYRAMYMEQPLDAADAAAGSEAFDVSRWRSCSRPRRRSSA